MSPEDTHKPIRFYIGGLILGVNTLYMFFCFFELFAVVGNELSKVTTFVAVGTFFDHHSGGGTEMQLW